MSDEPNYDIAVNFSEEMMNEDPTLPVVLVNGVRLKGVKSISIGDSIPGDDLIPDMISPLEITGTFYLSPEAGKRLFEFLFPETLTQLERFGAAKCVELAERIAFGAWAVRCAERLVRDA